MGGLFGALPSRLLVLVLVGACSAAAHGSSQAQYQLTLNLTSSNTLSVVTPSGAVLGTSTVGAQIPAGSYLVVVNNDVPDIRDTDHMFHFSGPGVIVLTDMGAGDNKTEAYQESLAPSSSYVFQDDRQPGIGRVVMGTAATVSSGGSSGGGSTVGSSGTSSNTGGSSSSNTSSNQSVVGSGTAAFRGDLTGEVTAAGKLTLAKGGRPVTSLKAGRYRITVTDKAPSGSFTIQKIRSSAHTLTGSQFVGRHTVTLNLTAGQWFYYQSFTGKKTYFIVVS